MKQTKGTEESKLSIFIAYFLNYVVGGSSYSFIGVAFKGLPPFLLGAFRFSAAELILLLWCWYRDEAIFKKNLIKKSTVSGIVLLFINMAVIMLAQQYVSSSLLAIIVSSSTIWIMALNVSMWKKNFRNPLIIIGVITGFLGVLLLYVEQFSLDTASDDHRKYGLLLLIFGCISWVLGTLYTKYRLSSIEKTNAFAGSAWQMLLPVVHFEYVP